MLEKRILSFVINLVCCGMLALVIAGAGIEVSKSLDTGLPILFGCNLAIALLAGWFWKSSGGPGISLLRLRLVMDDGNDVSLVRYLIRSLHFLMYWMLETYRLYEYVKGEPNTHSSLNDFLQFDASLRSPYLVLYSCMLVDKLAILYDYSQKTLLDRLGGTNVIYGGG